MSTIRNIIRKAARTVGRKELLHSIRARMRGVLHLSRPSSPLNRRENVAPFFIVGSGRCGTTLLRRLLQASPEIHIPPENWSMGGHVAMFRRYRWILSWTALVDLHLGRHAMESHRWFEQPPRELRNRLIQISDEEQSLARLLDEVYRYHGQCQDATFKQWGDKTPLNVGCMSEIIDVFPKGRFIHMLRDGVDVTYSWSRVEKYAGEVVAPSRRWKKAVTEARRFAQNFPDRFLEVRYEDLCHNPRETLRRVCSFIGISFEDALLSRSDHYHEMDAAQSIDHYENAFKSITTDSIGRGRENMSSGQKKALQPIINEKLVCLGYKPVEA